MSETAVDSVSVRSRKHVDACLAQGHRPLPRRQRRSALHPDFALDFVLVVAPSTPRTSPAMIRPITGKLRKRFWLDLTTSLGLGTSAGYAFWSVPFPPLPPRHASLPPSQ